MVKIKDGENSSFPNKRINILRELIKSGKSTLGTRLFSSWPLMVEIVGNSGMYDYIEFLAEYAPASDYDYANIARAAELHNMGTVIKVAYSNRALVAQKAVAGGFQAVLFTDHKSAGDVENSIKYLRSDCPQDGGNFGAIPLRPFGYGAEFTQMQLAETLRDIVCCFMIEKKEAVDSIEDICAVKGLDMIQFGPSDYSMSCGFNACDDPERINEAEIKCIKTAMRFGVRPRVEIKSPDAAKRYIDLGVKDFNIGSDIWNLADIWYNHGKNMRSILEPFT